MAAAAAAVVGTLSVLCQCVSAQTTAEEEYNYTTVPTTFTRGGDDNITYHDDGSTLEAARFGNTTMIVGLTMAGVLLVSPSRWRPLPTATHTPHCTTPVVPSSQRSLFAPHKPAHIHTKKEQKTALLL
jgi:hypothetical protein